MHGFHIRIWGLIPHSLFSVTKKALIFEQRTLIPGTKRNGKMLLWMTNQYAPFSVWCNFISHFVTKKNDYNILPDPLWTVAIINLGNRDHFAFHLLFCICFLRNMSLLFKWNRWSCGKMNCGCSVTVQLPNSKLIASTCWFCQFSLMKAIIWKRVISWCYLHCNIRNRLYLKFNFCIYSICNNVLYGMFMYIFIYQKYPVCKFWRLK